MHLRAVFITLVVAATGLAGCLGDEEASTDDVNLDLDADAQASATGVNTTLFQGNLVATFATPVRSFNNGGDFLHALALADNLTGLVFELEWTATDTSTGELSLWVQPANAGSLPPADPANVVFRPEPVARVDGASPLQLAVPADLLADGDYELVIRAGGQVGATVDQDFALHTTEFIGVAFDASYSALAGNGTA